MPVSDPLNMEQLPDAHQTQDLPNRTSLPARECSVLDRLMQDTL